MGTRNLTMVVVDGKVKVAQYGEFDGYPSGQGVKVLKFITDLIPLTSGTEYSDFLNKVRGCRFLTVEEFQNIESVSFKTRPIQGFWKTNHLHLSRDVAAEILMIINEKGPLELQDQSEFGKDGLFCEYAYVLDFDNRVFEVYRGFSKEPMNKGARFYVENPDTKGYYGVKLWQSYSFDNLPTKSEFCKLEQMDEE